MSDPTIARILKLEERILNLEQKYNASLDTIHKLFENQTDLISAVDSKYELVRTIMTEILSLMKNHISKETTK